MQKDQVLPALRGSISVTNCVLAEKRKGPYAMPEGSEQYLTWEASQSVPDKVCGSHKCCII